MRFDIYNIHIKLLSYILFKNLNLFINLKIKFLISIKIFLINKINQFFVS